MLSSSFFSVSDKIMSLSQRNREFPFASLHLDHNQLYHRGFIVYTRDYNWTKLTLCPVCFPIASMKCSVDCLRCFSVHLCACINYREQWSLFNAVMNELIVHQLPMLGYCLSFVEDNVKCHISENQLVSSMGCR